MKDRSQTITPETAVERARLASRQARFEAFIKQGERLGHDATSADKWVSQRVEEVSALPLETEREGSPLKRPATCQTDVAGARPLLGLSAPSPIPFNA